jgi:hypothetical protein
MKQTDETIKRNSGNLRQSETYGNESRGLTCYDRLGMFEAGLEELAKCFQFDAVNTENGVVVTITGVRRVNEPNGAWHLDPITVGT